MLQYSIDWSLTYLFFSWNIQYIRKFLKAAIKQGSNEMANFRDVYGILSLNAAKGLINEDEDPFDENPFMKWNPKGDMNDSFTILGCFSNKSLKSKDLKNIEAPIQWWRHFGRRRTNAASI